MLHAGTREVRPDYFTTGKIFEGLTAFSTKIRSTWKGILVSSFYLPPPVNISQFKFSSPTAKITLVTSVSGYSTQMSTNFAQNTVFVHAFSLKEQEGSLLNWCTSHHTCMHEALILVGVIWEEKACNLWETFLLASYVEMSVLSIRNSVSIQPNHASKVHWTTHNVS